MSKWTKITLVEMFKEDYEDAERFNLIMKLRKHPNMRRPKNSPKFSESPMELLDGFTVEEFYKEGGIDLIEIKPNVYTYTDKETGKENIVIAEREGAVK